MNASAVQVRMILMAQKEKPRRWQQANGGEIGGRQLKELVLSAR